MPNYEELGPVRPVDLFFMEQPLLLHDSGLGEKYRSSPVVRRVRYLVGPDLALDYVVRLKPPLPDQLFIDRSFHHGPVRVEFLYSLDLFCRQLLKPLLHRPLAFFPQRGGFAVPILRLSREKGYKNLHRVCRPAFVTGQVVIRCEARVEPSRITIREQMPASRGCCAYRARKHVDEILRIRRLQERTGGHVDMPVLLALHAGASDGIPCCLFYLPDI